MNVSPSASCSASSGLQLARQLFDALVIHPDLVEASGVQYEHLGLEAVHRLVLRQQGIDRDALVFVLQAPEQSLFVQVVATRAIGGVVEAAEGLLVDQIAREQHAVAGGAVFAVVQDQPVILRVVAG